MVDFLHNPDVPNSAYTCDHPGSYGAPVSGAALLGKSAVNELHPLLTTKSTSCCWGGEQAV